MELKQKGASAQVPRFKQLLATMSWSTGMDFDLALVYETKDGKTGLVYFGDLGDLNAFPFMSLSGDEGVGDKAGKNEEQVRIASLDQMAKVHLVCWDYGKIGRGEPARFVGSDVKLAVMDDAGATTRSSWTPARSATSPSSPPSTTPAPWARPSSTPARQASSRGSPTCSRSSTSSPRRQVLSTTGRRSFYRHPPRRSRSR